MKAEEISGGVEAIDGKTVLLCPNPHCGDTGGYATGDGYGGYEQEQCEFCWAVPNSKFNHNHPETTEQREG